MTALDHLAFGLDLLFPHTRDGWLDLRAIRQSDNLVVHHFLRGESTPAQIMAWVDSVRPTEQYNFYIGRALRATADGTKKGIDTIQAISFDVDALRSERSRPASEEEVGFALGAASSILGFLEGRGSILHSGNGAQVWVPLARPVDVRGRRRWFQDANRSFEQDIVSKLGDQDALRVSVDPQYDLPRIVKLPGTVSRKGVCDAGSGRIHRHVAFQDLHHRPERLDGERILDLAPEETEEAPLSLTAGAVPERFWAELGRNESIRAGWLGTGVFRDSSGSGQDWHLATACRRRGFTPEECLSILAAAPGGKERGDHRYRELTVRKAYGLG